MEDGDAAAGLGGADTGLVGAAGATGAAHGGAGGAATSDGGSSAPSFGGMSAAGMAPALDAPGGGSGWTSAGGPSGGGSAVVGAGGAIAIKAPRGCRSTSQSADAATCNYVYDCGGQTHFDDCRLDSGGAWSCDCGTFSSNTRYFEIEGVDALDACGTIARVCESGDLSVSPTKTCRTLERTNDGSSCSAHDTCGNAVDFDLPEGVVVRAIDHYRASCKPTTTVYVTDTPFRCSCQGAEAGGYGALTSAPSVDDVCDPFIQFCREDQDAAYTDRVCGYGPAYGLVEQACPGDPKCQGCSIAQECALAAPLGNGVSIIDEQNATTHSIDCVPKQGALHCVCDSMDAVYGDDTVPESVLDVCSASLTVCQP